MTEATAMVYYEMLFNSGHATRRVKNNLCYLYGKRGAWFEAKELIEQQSEDKAKIDALKNEINSELQKVAQNMAAQGGAQSSAQQNTNQNKGGDDDVIDAEVE